jgi:DnaJ homolog subfamily C member 28
MFDQQNRRRSLMDEIIDEATKNGTFSDSSKYGKPLNLWENPYVPEDQKMSFKILSDNGFAPAWIEDGKEIRGDIERARDGLKVSYRYFEQTLSKLKQKVNIEAVYAQKAVYETWDKACDAFRAEAERINKKIFNYNLKVPIVTQQMMQLDADREIEKVAGKI